MNPIFIIFIVNIIVSLLILTTLHGWNKPVIVRVILIAFLFTLGSYLLGVTVGVFIAAIIYVVAFLCTKLILSYTFIETLLFFFGLGICDMIAGYLLS